MYSENSSESDVGKMIVIAKGIRKRRFSNDKEDNVLKDFLRLKGSIC